MTTNTHNQLDKAAEDTDPDALLDALENEDDAEYRAQRLQQLQTEAKAVQAFSKADVAYVTLNDDDETLRFTTEHERAVVHFYHPDFARCSTMDVHLREIASKHTELGNADVAFGRTDVQKTPFLIEKLGIRVLPCVLGFVKGVTKGRVTGFEGIAWEGRESGLTVTAALEEKLVEWTVLKKKLIEAEDDSEEEDDTAEKKQDGRRGIRGGKREVVDEDDDWD